MMRETLIKEFHSYSERMKRALNECAVTGIPTTIDFHLQLLEREEFLNGDVHTKFVEQEMLS